MKLFEPYRDSDESHPATGPEVLLVVVTWMATLVGMILLGHWFGVMQ